MPISPPKPNSPPSANWVEALCRTIAESTSARNRAAAAGSSVTIASVWWLPWAAMWRIAPATPSTCAAAQIASRYSVSQSSAHRGRQARVERQQRGVGADLAAGIEQRLSAASPGSG